MSRILLTAFEPFGGDAGNSSQVVAETALPRLCRQWDVRYCLLPVTRNGAFGHVIEEMADFDPAIVIMLGQAGKRRRITPERVAINLDVFHIPDNAGEQPIAESICEGGPVGYFSTLPVEAIADRLVAEGVAAKVSNSAGLYVCNHVFYSIMHHVARMAPAPMAGLIHLPRIGDPDTAHRGGLPLECMTRGVELAIAECVAGMPD